MKRTIILMMTAVFFQAAFASQTPEGQTPQERAETLVGKMTLDEKISLISGYKDGFHIAGVERLGIPSVRMADGPQGVRNNTKSTFYPCGVSLAATWNTDVASEMGRGLGLDARARGVGIMLGPGVNIYRSAHCGRNFEYYGEDPCLASAIACSYITGMQKEGVIATVKHFAANNQEYNRHAVNSVVDERTLQEIYFPAFRNAVKKAGVGAVMTSYNPLNGTHAAESSWLTRDILRESWGFDGIIMSDWTSTYTTLGCIESELDLEMPRGYWMNHEMIKELIGMGMVREEQIDRKCVNILKTLIKFNLVDRPVQCDSLPEDNPVCHEIAYKTAIEGPVLLKNSGLLPLDKKILRGAIAIVGPNADTIPFGGGSGAVSVMDGVGTTLLSGMRAMAGEKRVVYAGDGCGGNFDEEAVRNARVVIVSAGFTRDTEGEGFDRTYHLPGGQDDMIARVAALNENVIVVVNSGGEVAMPWLQDVEAVVMAWYPGQAGGTALADIFSGKVSPSGKLPFTIWGSEEANPSFAFYPMRENEILPQKRDKFLHTVYKEGVFIGYRGMGRFGVEPLFPFGYGLTYSDFEYSGLEVSEAGDGAYDVAFTVKNVGKCRAAAVPQVYARECAPVVARPDRELKAFEKLWLDAGKSQRVVLRLEREDFSFYDVVTGDFRVQPGTFRIFIGSDAASLLLCAEVEIK